MRITGGTYRGRVIQVPKGLPVRPTTDRTREALFSILQHKRVLTDSKVLDLFTGTGIISLEALSRGAAEVTAVDKHRRCIQALKKLKDLYQLTNLNIGQADAMQYVRHSDEAFHLIFMDPPYQYAGISALIDLIFERRLLHADGLLVVEHDPHRDFSTRKEFLMERVYGSSGLSFFAISV